MSLLYDISKAHKLIPICERDWGLQAFRLPDDESGDVFVHTRGTFGVASAAYWWGRCASGIVRLAHRLGHGELALYHLLYADDGWLTATGSWFWRKLLYWMFILGLAEVPVSWSKVCGGVRADWIGYRLDVHKYERGISDKKKAWVREWIERKLQEGGVVGRDLKSVLGRLSFVAGALKHVRPFYERAHVFVVPVEFRPGRGPPLLERRDVREKSCGLLVGRPPATLLHRNCVQRGLSPASPGLVLLEAAAGSRRAPSSSLQMTPRFSGCSAKTCTSRPSALVGLLWSSSITCTMNRMRMLPNSSCD